MFTKLTHVIGWTVSFYRIAGSRSGIEKMANTNVAVPDNELERRARLEYIATQSGVPASFLNVSNRSLILAIQKARGEETCFMSDKRFLCEKYDCEWRKDCVKLKAAWR